MSEINNSIDWIAAGLLFARFGLALVMLISAAFIARSLSGDHPPRCVLVQASVASFVFAGAAAVLIAGFSWSGELW